MTNINYKDQYFKLQDYLSKYYNIKIKLQPDVTDAWYPFLNLIMINSNLKYRERFFTLLHESGHAILDHDVKHLNVLCFSKNTPDNIRSKSSYVHNLNEEILAWNYGKDLSRKIGLVYEEDKLENYMTDCIMSYTKHGLESLYGKNVDVDSIYIKYV